MPRAVSLGLLGLLGLLVVVSVALPARAATFVMVPDEGLVDKSSLIVTGRIAEREPAPLTTGMPHTDYRVEIGTLLKGDVSDPSLTVRIPGGERPDGVRGVLFGAPFFEPGERVLLFLDPAQDGTWRIRHLMLGAFHLIEREGTDGAKVLTAERDLAGSRQVSLPAWRREEPGAWRGARSSAAFSTWIEDRLRGERRPPDYFLPEPLLQPAGSGSEPGELRSQSDPFTLLRNSGRLIRWFEFDEGETVVWQALRPQPGLSPAQRRHALERGLEIWNTVSAANIRLELGDENGGTTTGFANPDGVNTILFDDPNLTFGQGFDCDPENGGGPLAAAVPWVGGEVRTYRGQPHGVIEEADIVFNSDLDCYFASLPNPQGTADAITGHEIGHTLGFGHSSPRDPEPEDDLRDALMYFRARGELGRDAQLSADDRAAARALYRTGPPASPTDLRAEEVSDTEALLAWTDNATDENSFRVERAEEDGPFVQIIGFLPRNSEAVTVGDLVPGTRYRFRVRARNELGFSGYSNEAEWIPGRVEAPSGLRVVRVTESEVVLSWTHPRFSDTGFRIEIRSPEGTLEPLVFAPGEVPSSVAGLDPETPYTFQVLALRNGVESEPGGEVSATTLAEAADDGPCEPADGSLCLLENRFRVQVAWRDPRSGEHGVGRAVAVPGSDVSGLFWFFDAANIELIVKMIDAVGLSGFYWTFYGGLSDVEYWITVTDAETGEQVTYRNPPGEICGLADVESFPRDRLPLPSSARTRSLHNLHTFRPPDPPILRKLAAPGTGISGTCVQGPETLCLVDGRFRVEVDWVNPRIADDRGPGRVAPVESVTSDSTGFFWFFSPETLELVVKVLDGRTVNGRFWFFYGALSDVEYRITVTDTVEGIVRIYENQPFDLCGDADVQAF